MTSLLGGNRASAIAFALGAALSVLLSASPASAWLLHEHVRVGYAGLLRLPAGERRVLQDAWSVVRLDAWAASHLCKSPVQRAPVAFDDPAVQPWCLGFATLPALSADHSCDPEDLIRTLQSDWVYPVLREANRFDVELEGKILVLDRLDARRGHDIELALDDALFLKRAQSNDAHFQMTRITSEPSAGPNRASDLATYLHRALATGQATNATALYVNYHAAALARALDARAACARAGAPCAAARAAIWDALTAEGFALHFLEDSFSAGHFVGTWGGSSQRFGTHDYYCRHGVEARLFDSGDDGVYVAHGDLFLTDEDERRTSRAIAESLGQFLRALDPQTPGADADRLRAELDRATPDRTYDACANEGAPPGLDALESSSVVRAVAFVPMPAVRTPEMPRFQAEYGGFLGASIGNEVSALRELGSPGKTLVDLRLRVALRAGLGLEGILSRYMDGALFVEFLYGGTWRPIEQRAMSGLGGRIHLPFAVIPGDGLLAPLLVTGLKPFVWIAKNAALGSIWGRFEGLSLIGEDQTFQICLGRDFSFLYYPGDKDSTAERRWEFFLPAVNMRLGRAYSGTIGNQLDIDLGFQATHPTAQGARNAFGAYLTISAGSRIFP
jgi:hypothetical protein